MDTAILTDGSPEAAALIGAAPDLPRLRAADLPPPDRTLWEALAPGTAPHAGGSAPPGWSRLLAVRSAPASQFDVLRDLLAAGLDLPGPVACLAAGGTGFHGHRGRPWRSPPGNLYLSAAFAPEDLPAAGVIAWTVLPAVATVDAIRAAGLSPGIKWVNDVLIGGRKVAGVLTATQSQGDRLAAAILGIGVNVARTPDVPPTPFVPAVRSLREVPGGEALAPALLLPRLLDALARRYRGLLARGPSALFCAYREVSLVVGSAVRVWPEGLDDLAPAADWPPPLAAGIVTDLLPDLSLRIEGRADPVTRGRLAFEESCRRFGL